MLRIFDHPWGTRKYITGAGINPDDTVHIRNLSFSSISNMECDTLIIEDCICTTISNIHCKTLQLIHWANNLTLINVTFNEGIVNEGSAVSFVGCDLEHSSGLILNDPQGVVFQGCYFENNETDLVLKATNRASTVSLVGCYVNRLNHTTPSIRVEYDKWYDRVIRVPKVNIMGCKFSAKGQRLTKPYFKGVWPKTCGTSFSRL